MAEKDRFTDDEWRQLVSAPGAASVAIVAGNHFGLMKMFKELRGVAKALKTAQKDTAWPPVVAEMIAYIDKHNKEMTPPDSSDDPDKTLGTSLDSLSKSGVAAAKLTPEELDGYVKWVIGIGTGAAEATTDKGDESAISDSERELLADMEQRLRAG